jgi:hypothetical protein
MVQAHNNSTDRLTDSKELVLSEKNSIKETERNGCTNAPRLFFENSSIISIAVES